MTLQEKLKEQEQNYLILSNRQAGAESELEAIKDELRRTAGKIQILQELIREEDA